MTAPPQLSVIVPFFNEEKTLLPIIERLTGTCLEAQIIYVDDGSSDASLALLRKHVRSVDTVITKPNGGKGSALREGRKHVRGEYCIIQDADLEYDPEDIPLLLREAREHHIDLLLGSRRLRKQDRQYSRLRYFIGGNLLSSLCNLLFGTKITDVMTCYKLMRSDVFQTVPLHCNRFDMDTEIVASIAKAGYSIEERGISYHPRSAKEGKKINWKDFFRCVWCLVRIRFSPKAVA